MPRIYAPKSPSDNLEFRRRRSWMFRLAAGWCTMAEVADVLNVSRQAVRKWCVEQGIDAVYARQRWLARHDNRSVSDNRAPPSKETLRKIGHNAEQRWRARKSTPI